MADITFDAASGAPLITFELRPIDIFGFDVVTKIYPSEQDSRIIFIRWGPFSGAVLAVAAPQEFPKALPALTGAEIPAAIHHYFQHRQEADPVWRNHKEVWFSRALLRMLYICRHILSNKSDSPYLRAAQYHLQENIDDAFSIEESTQALADALHFHTCAMIDTVLEGAISSIEPHPEVTEEEIENAMRDVDGVFWIDACLADYIAKLPGGTEYANRMRESSRKRLAASRNNPTLETIDAVFSTVWLRRHAPEPVEPFIMRPAEVLWHGIVKPRLEREEHERRNPPAISVTYAKRIPEAFWKSSTQLSQDPDSGEIFVKNKNTLPPDIVARAPVIEARRGRTMFGELAEIHAALGSRAGQELIQWLITQAHRNTHDKIPDPRKIIRFGGIDAICEELNLAKGRDSKTLYDALVAGKRFELCVPGEIHQLGLWTATIEGGKGRKQSIVTIEVSSFLAPHYKRAICESERLVPIVPTPPLVGRRNDYSAQMAFKWALICSMVEAGTDLLNGGVLLTEEDLERMARSVSLPIPTMRKALEKWTHDEDDKKDGAPKMLDPKDGEPKMLVHKNNRYQLANTEPYRHARAFIWEGASRSKENSERVKKRHRNNKQ